jgi:hypothetical protein
VATGGVSSRRRGADEFDQINVSTLICLLTLVILD